MLSSIDARKFNTLTEVSTLINSNFTDTHTLFTYIVDSAARLCDGEASALFLGSREGDEFHFDITQGGKGGAAKKFAASEGEGIAGWVIQHNTSLIVNDPENDERYVRSAAHTKRAGRLTRNILAVPMRLRDECAGVIEIINKKGNQDFSQEDLEWLGIFANQAILAIQNARNFEKAPERVERQDYHALIAKSPVTLAVLEKIDRIAKTDSSVLILGESGVGKEVFAEQIHLRSKRAKAPFVRVNCAAIPEGLLESELFGHVKGAFTDAVRTRRGRFETADKGTIFLDEIGELPLTLQAKLLRVIQEKTFEKVGSDVSVSVDVRILAATNRDIEALVNRGEFREDLYYRLNVLPLVIPPLRERPEDIAELALHFLKAYAGKSRKEILSFSQEAMEALLAYSWPGNVRELENCVERSCAIGKGPRIETGDLLLKNTFQGPSGNAGGDGRDLKTAINAFKAYYIKKVLEENRWNQTEAAKALAIQRTYLSRLIRELDIAYKEHKEAHHGEG